MDPPRVNPAATIFRWETLHEIERHLLPYEQPVSGVKMEVELTTGSRINVFRGDDPQFYFCHGLSFGGINAPQGAVSPYSGKAVSVILAELYVQVTPESNAVAGDVLVWYDFEGEPIHSAIMIQPVVDPAGNWLDFSSTLRSKNGNQSEATMSLQILAAGERGYGESYRVFRRAQEKE